MSVPPLQIDFFSLAVFSNNWCQRVDEKWAYGKVNLVSMYPHCSFCQYHCTWHIIKQVCRSLKLFSDLKSWVAVLSNDNIAPFAFRQEATEINNTGSFCQAIYSLSRGVNQATIMAAVTSVSTLLFPTHYHSSETGGVWVLLSAATFDVAYVRSFFFFLTQLSNTPPLWINFLLPSLVSFIA